jgi:hypothetical protein
MVAALAAPASAVTPALPPGAPAVESAPSSLVGLNPQLPAAVVAASAARTSHWKPEKAIYGTASINDIAIKGAPDALDRRHAASDAASAAASATGRGVYTIEHATAGPSSLTLDLLG